jgi:hypothetical protein
MYVSYWKSIYIFSMQKMFGPLQSTFVAEQLIFIFKIRLL